MNKFLNNLLTFTLVLFALSFALPSFGQPPIRQETRGGSGQTGCDLTNNDEDQTLQICIYVDDITWFQTCDFYVGYDLFYSDMSFADANNWTSTNNHPSGDWRTCFDVVYSAAEIEHMCLTETPYIQLDYFCLINGVYENIFDELGPPTPIDLCCPPIGRGGITGNNLTANSAPKIITLDNTSIISAESKVQPITDYYIFDIHGNQIKISKNISKEISVQQYISTLNIRPGIYVVKYWHDQKMKTEKVFKF